ELATAPAAAPSLRAALPIVRHALADDVLGDEGERLVHVVNPRLAQLVDLGGGEVLGKEDAILEDLPDAGDGEGQAVGMVRGRALDRKSTRLNASHVKISYAV